jgi:mono/diheme cytochrome c family protein
MIWVKHFDYPTQWESFIRSIDGQPRTDRRPVAGSPRRRLETRFLVKNGTGSYGLTYRWNSTQSDALLVDDDGESVPLAITLDGAPSNLIWNIPSRAACITCHTPEAGHALSFNTRQLNLAGSIAGVSGNLLGVLNQTGYLAGLNAAPATLPRHFRPDESAQSLEARVRSYLDVNCAYCHQSGGTGGGNWDGRAHLSLLATGLLNGPTVEAPLDPAHRLVVAGNVPHSILYNRLAGANGYTRMPPLGTVVPDLEAEELVTAWIREEVHPYASYEEWRTAKFGNATSPQGQPGQNPEGDGLDNFGEWVFGTDPVRMDDFRATPQLLVVAPESGVFRFTHRRLRMHATAGLDYVYRTSDDLIDWAAASGVEESVAVSGTDPAYEIVTVSFAPGSTVGNPRLFVKVEVNP